MHWHEGVGASTPGARRRRGSIGGSKAARLSRRHRSISGAAEASKPAEAGFDPVVSMHSMLAAARDESDRTQARQHQRIRRRLRSRGADVDVRERAGQRTVVHVIDGIFRQPIGIEALPADKDRKSTRLNSSHLVISYAV